MDALGGSTSIPTARRRRRASTTPTALAILHALHTLRFTDNAMSATQGLAWGTLQQQFAAGKLGMYIAAPDDIYNVIVPTDKGNINDIGMGRCQPDRHPGGLARRRQCLHLRQARHPRADRGRHQVHQLRGPDARPGPFNFARQKADGIPVGFDEPQLFDGATGARSPQLRNKYATINSLVLPALRQCERGQRRRAVRRSGCLQDAGPGDAGRAHRAERQHPGSC